jgi:hypothetical protein
LRNEHVCGRVSPQLGHQTLAYLATTLGGPKPLPFVTSSLRQQRFVSRPCFDFWRDIQGYASLIITSVRGEEEMCPSPT